MIKNYKYSDYQLAILFWTCQKKMDSQQDEQMRIQSILNKAAATCMK